MKVLITGVAGFIGYHLARRLLSHDYEVFGIDNLNNYYSPKIKRDRLKILKKSQRFNFFKIDITNKSKLEKLFQSFKFELIIHLAAQAGVRYSLTNPDVYIKSNIVGFFNLLDIIKNSNSCKKLIYASSSSVYGNNNKFPFNEEDLTDYPVSLYAATKKSNELIAHSYSHLYKIKMIGLRFFTVYGPFGRPDMAPWLFTESIIKKREIKVFNNGNLLRDFTYIDDIVEGIFGSILLINNKVFKKHVILNLGNNKPNKLIKFISYLENLLGIKARKKFLPMQSGDVYKTAASTSKAKDLIGYQPKTNLKDGLKKWVEWYNSYHGDL